MKGAVSVRPVEVADGVLIAVESTARVLARSDLEREDRVRAATMAPWRARQYLAARCLLRHLLAEAVADPGAGIAVRPSGQPYLAAHPGVGISLSHTDGVVAAAVALGRQVGVDVQEPTSASPALVARCCTPSGRAVLGSMPPARRPAALARIWAVQEACVKAAGSGLLGRPWTIAVEPGQRLGRWSAYEWLSLGDRFETPAACAFTAGDRP
jgi:4'-phosphopantetheinyl transferase